ncbi:MAG: gamma-glutamyl-gamma-aminobutyrate hydrolase family protein [Pseudomonadota bacterium]
MARPVVGIVGNAHLINDQYLVHGGSAMCSQAISDVTQAVPLIVPTCPDLVDLDDLMAACDGFLLTGGRPNVHPEEYGHAPTEAHGTFDRKRDAIALGLVKACIDSGQPILAVCRGFQEMNVAMGGTLHPEIRDLPGRMNHRMPPDGTIEEKFELRHDVHFTPGGVFARLMGSDVVRTNTLHGQGIEEAGERIIIDGRAEDTTPEAIYIDGAPGFALGVQWHAEYNAAGDPVSRKLFEAFGDALRAWAGGARPGRLKSA